MRFEPLGARRLHLSGGWKLMRVSFLFVALKNSKLLEFEHSQKKLGVKDNKHGEPLTGGFQVYGTGSKEKTFIINSRKITSFRTTIPFMALNL